MAKLNWNSNANRNARLSNQPTLHGDHAPLAHALPTRNRNICPIGKYKNYHWQDIPADYLRWASTNWTGDIQQRAHQALKNRA